MNTSDKQVHFPDLETERLYLRRLQPDDLDFVFQHFSDPAVTEFLLDEPPITDIAQAQEIIDFYQEPEGKPYNRWGITLKTTGELIGTCGFHKWETRYFRAEIGYDLSPGFWGQGYMAEALEVVLQNGFEQMDLNRIDALVSTENTRSIRLLEKLGFQNEGNLRDYFYTDGKFYNHYLLALLRRDWESR